MMTRINCMIVGFSLLSCSLVAMDKSRALALWQQNNKLELQIWEQNNKRQLVLEAELRLRRDAKLEEKRLSNAATMDRESYLQRYGTPEEYFSYTRGVE
jgi:hypothetical protein